MQIILRGPHECRFFLLYFGQPFSRSSTVAILTSESRDSEVKILSLKLNGKKEHDDLEPEELEP